MVIYILISSVVLSTVLLFREIETLTDNLIFICLFLTLLGVIVYGLSKAQDEEELVPKRAFISLKHI